MFGGLTKPQFLHWMEDMGKINLGEGLEQRNDAH